MSRTKQIFAFLLILPFSGNVLAETVPADIPPDALPEKQVTQQSPDKPKVYGEWIFKGKFAANSFSGFNPEYRVSVGDEVVLQLWGAIELTEPLLPLTVDAQGNIFVPRVGPIRVLNVRNQDLNSVIESKIKTVYRENVGVYASLASAQKVKVFISGNVPNPGLYEGFAADSILHFLDLAGGIAPDRGSYLDIRVIRNGEISSSVNLYDFLLNGAMPIYQFRDGDSIFVGPLRNTVTFNGLVNNPYRIEFASEILPLSDALKIVGIYPNATHIRLTRNNGREQNLEYATIEKSTQVVLSSGDEVTVLADKTLATIIVKVEGEHSGASEYVLPYGANIADLLERLKPSPDSNIDNIQLYRRSLAERQKFLLDQSLRALESNVLSARSETLGEAGLRTQEAGLILQFIERAEKVEPRGQVVLPNAESKYEVRLENGDVIRIPKNSHLVTVHGEVYFPSAFLYQDRLRPPDYIELAGGYSQKADKTRLLIMHQNGAVEQYKASLFNGSGKLQPGDEILIMPEVDVKSFQFTKDLVEVIYQIAVSAGVILRI